MMVFSPTEVVTVGVLLAFLLMLLIIDNVRANNSLKASHEETRRVLDESQRRLEEAHREISRTLHDEVNPSLLYGRNELKRLEGMVHDHPEVVRSMTAIQMLLNDAYAHVRGIIKNIRMEVIDTVGFISAIEALVAHYTYLYAEPKIELRHNLPSKLAVDDRVAIAAYSIIREAVFNALKHSQAKTVKVTLVYKSKNEAVHVVVADDGVGIKRRALSNGDVSCGIGVFDMRERARTLGGTLKIDSHVGSKNCERGTRVSFSFSPQSLSNRT